MSTINPALAVQAREAAKAARVGSGRALALLLATDFGLAAGGFLAVAGLSSLFAVARLEESNAFPLVALLPLLLPVGILSSVGFLIAQAFARRAYTGSDEIFAAVVDGSPVWLAGAATGAWTSLVLLQLTAPPVQAGLPAEWIATTLPLVLPIGLTAALATSLWRRSARRRRRERKVTMLTDVFRSGTRTPGVVTETVRRAPEGGRQIARWTVSFTDAIGQTRWVTPLGLFHEDSLPAAGDVVTVLYDPANPSETSRIFIAREHPERIESYTAHRPPFPFDA